MRYLLFFICLLGFQVVLEAQPKSFSTEPEVFITEFETFIKSAHSKKLDEDIKLFKENWILGKITENQQRYIIRISNDMLMEKMQVQPHFELFLSAFAAFYRKGLPDKILVQWQGITKSLLGKNNKDYLAFLQMSVPLFEENIIYKDEAKYWYSDHSNYELLYIDNQIAIKFPSITLRGKGPIDQVEILQTSGTYYLGKSLWIGNGGRTDFSRTMRGENAFVQFSQYKIFLNLGNYEVDSAKLNYPKYFAAPVSGKFKDIISNNTDTQSIKELGYPQFTTYSNSLEIKGLVGNNATYKGGLTIKGSEINTENAENKESEIAIYFKSQKKAVIRSKSFKIANGIAASKEAFFIIYTDSGNIYHPRAIINFNFKEDKLTVTRGETGLTRVPFTDDYHKIDLDVKQIRWKIDEAFIDFDNINNDEDAKIASQDFYREIIYARIQGGLAFNPLDAIQAYWNNHLRSKVKGQKSRMKFHISDFAAFMNNTKDNLITPMIELHDMGFINYFMEQDSIEIKPKLFNYNMAHNKVRDYDVIRFSSLISARPNATLNLLSNELKVEGVAKFYFSDSQNVVVVPTEQQITILKNRRVKFGGMIRAGRFDFFGKDFQFDYNNFSVAYSNIDSMRLYFPDSTGKAIVPIKSVLKNIYGTLLIDKPNNKSGNINYPEYPIFVASKGSEITYDKPSIHGGAYHADRFKFVVDPFTIDSLDNFTLSGLQFDGTFYSDDIFPVFRYKASIQRDYSLGFITHTPPEGYPMYKGAGRGDMTISLSEEGLYGGGEIEFHGSKTKTARILLLPDQASGAVESYSIAQNSVYPDLHINNATTLWKPYDDQLTVNKGSENFKVFKMGYDFDGSITQSGAGLSGNGNLFWSEASYASKDMKIGPNQASAESASLKIYAADSTKIAFETYDVKGGLNFDTRKGDFTTNIVGAETRFPFNAYVTNLNDYRWNMNEKTIEAKVGPSMVGNPYWRSTNPDQDSLSFEGKKGTYDLAKFTLEVEQIPYIDIADSRLFLKNGIVIIRENANMDQVDSARILANREDKFHDIYRTTAKILGKNKIRANGKYVYVDKLGTKQEFTLDSIIVNREKHVEAIGKIEESNGFTLDTKIGYKGYARAMSTTQNIQFIGYVKPLHTFKNVLPSAWIRFNDTVDPKNVVINVTDPRDKDNKKQYVGLFIANDSSHVYPLFFSWKRRYSDPAVTNDTGVLFYDQEKQSFFAGSKDKLIDGSLKGAFLQLNESNHTVHAEGPMDLGLETKSVKFVNAGTADLLPGDSSFSFNLAMMLDFPLPKEWIDRVNELMKGQTPDVNLNNPFFLKALGEMVADEKDARTMMKNVEKTGILSGKEEANYKFVFSDASFRWDSKRRGLVCNGQVEWANFAGTSINRTVNMTMLVEHKRSGENIHLYMEINGTDWIYINLTKTKAFVISSDPKLNEIFALNADKAATEDFSLGAGTIRMKDKFLFRFE